MSKKEEVKKESISNEFENFQLLNVKLVKGGGLICAYRALVNGERFDNFTLESAVNPHSDLTDLFQELHGVASRILGLESIYEIGLNKDAGFTQVQTSILHNTVKILRERITVTKVSIQKPEFKDMDKQSCIVSFNYLTESNQPISMNTPKIHFGSSTFGFEATVMAIVEELKKEVFEYIFNGKADQLRLAFDGDLPTKEDNGED